MLIRIGGGLAIVLVLYFLLRSTSKKAADYGNYANARFERYAPYGDDDEDPADDNEISYGAGDMNGDESDGEMTDDMADDMANDMVDDTASQDYEPEPAEGMGYSHSYNSNAYESYDDQPTYDEQQPTYDEPTYEQQPTYDEPTYEQQPTYDEQPAYESYTELSDGDPDVTYSPDEQEDEVGEEPGMSQFYEEVTPVESFNAYGGNYEEFTVMESTLDDSRANGMFATPF